nr:hypothetical protein [Tanacetum cinerariifolium]
MVNSCLKKLKSHLASFDMVVKERTTATAITEGTWGFEHTKACFRDDIIPFVKALKELFTSFDQCLIAEVTEVQNVFKQMELAVEQHHEKKHKFQNKMEIFLQENDRLLTQALSVEIVNVVIHDNVKSACLDKNTFSSLESAPTFEDLFEINELKAQVQEKDTVILKLKEKLCSLNGDVNGKNVKREFEEIETLNIELDHKVTKLVTENEHLKQTYKQLYDSIKSSRIQSKEQCDDLINKVNLKFVEVSDLNASLQEKVLVITALKEQLNKLKGKAVLTEDVSLNPIDPNLLKDDVAPLVLKLRKNMTAHTDYIRHTQDEAATFREIVESERLLSPFNTSLDYALKRKVWKPTGNLFKTVGHIWKPIGRTFKLVRNVCPLTRIATPTIVPPREPIPIVNSADKPVVTLVYTRKPKAANKKVPIKLEPNNSWGSSSFNVPFSLLTCRDYQIGNVTISQVYYVEGLGHNLFSIGQFCDSDLEVAFRQHTCFIHNLDGVDLLTGSRGNNLYTLSLQDMMASSPISCAMGKSTKKTHKPKSEDTNQEKLYLLHMDLCEPMVRRIQTDNRTEFVNQTLRDYYEEVGISHETSVARSPQQNEVVERRNRTLIEAARTINDWDLLFQPMFDELLNPPPSVVNQAPEVVAPIAEVIPQVDADSTVIPQDVEDDNLDMEVAHMGNDPLLGVPIPEVTSAQSSSTASPQSIMQPNHPMTHHNSKWTKDHPLNNIIGQLSRPVSTRLQLHEQAFFCYYDAFMTSVEPKTYKEALTQACWIEAIQEELNEFERLEVWKLVPRPDQVMEEGIDFKELFALVARLEAIRIFLAYAAHKNMVV